MREWNRDELLAGLRDAADEAFETMLSGIGKFSFAQPDSYDGDAVEVEASVEFSGDNQGAVVLRCTMAGALNITRTLLLYGDDEQVPMAEVEDAIGECANVVVGILKTRALDTVGSYKLGTPRVETYTDPGIKEHGGSVIYALSQGIVSLEIYMDRLEPAA